MENTLKLSFLSQGITQSAILMEVKESRKTYEGLPWQNFVVFCGHLHKITRTLLYKTSFADNLSAKRSGKMADFETLTLSISQFQIKCVLIFART